LNTGGQYNAEEEGLLARRRIRRPGCYWAEHKTHSSRQH